MTSFEKTTQAIKTQRQTSHLVKGFLAIEKELDAINEKLYSTSYAEEKAKYNALSDAKEQELQIQFKALESHLGNIDAVYEALEA